VVRHNIKKIKNFFTDTSKNFISNYIYKIVAAGFIFAFAFTNISTQFVNAIGGQVQSRSIELSSSATSATGVSYQVQFYPTATTAVGGIVVDFCSNDPIVGDTCTAPASPFSVGATPTFTGPTGLAAGGTWGATSNAAHNTFYLTNTTADAPTSTSTYINFTITNVTNTVTLGSFYARILTFDTKADATAYTSGQTGTITGELDYGGVALSTVSQITITVKVQEQITFCIYTAALDLGTCNAATGSTIALGNASGVLSTQGPYVDITTKYDLQTNALHGDIVRFTGTVPTSGTNVIESSTLSGTGSTAATAYASTTGSPQFGLCTYPAAGTTTNVTVAATYASNAGSTYNGTEAGDACFSQTSQSSGTGTTGGAGTATFGYNVSAAATSGYGDTLLTGIAGGYTQGIIAILGNISPSTYAGIYTNTLNFVATGTY
jgi:hypothetical protein